ncbi:hypothetical protein PLESTF_001452000 [Pleodorina starrii]|nr:hypothetical protein PLESTF_001452000 [Pleodorina starrii]
MVELRLRLLCCRGACACAETTRVPVSVQCSEGTAVAGDPRPETKVGERQGAVRGSAAFTSCMAKRGQDKQSRRNESRTPGDVMQREWYGMITGRIRTNTTCRTKCRGVSSPWRAKRNTHFLTLCAVIVLPGGALVRQCHHVGAVHPLCYFKLAFPNVRLGTRGTRAPMKAKWRRTSLGSVWSRNENQIGGTNTSKEGAGGGGPSNPTRAPGRAEVGISPRLHSTPLDATRCHHEPPARPPHDEERIRQIYGTLTQVRTGVKYNTANPPKAHNTGPASPHSLSTRIPIFLPTPQTPFICGNLQNKNRPPFKPPAVEIHPPTGAVALALATPPSLSRPGSRQTHHPPAQFVVEVACGHTRNRPPATRNRRAAT